jgi:uncharacterized membrane protein
MNENHPPSEEFKQLNERLDYLEQLVRDQVGRIYRLEQHLGLEKTALRLEPLPEAQPAPVIENVPPVEAAEPVPDYVPPQPLNIEAEAEPVEAVTPAESEPQEREWNIPPQPVTPAPVIGQFESERRTAAAGSGFDLESLIGGRWFNLIGTVAVILGVGFFLKLAFDQGWVGPMGKVIIGLVIGAGMIIGGDRIRARGYRTYAQGLFGGGIVILYLSIFAAFARYQIIGQLPAFAMMTLVTATAVLLAARYDSLAIAILGLIGGFLTPIMLSTGKDNETGLFSYIVLLDLGVLAVAYFKQWRVLNYLAFWATVLMAAGWMRQWYEPAKLWPTIFFFTLFFVIFATLAIFHNVINHRPTTRLDLSLIFTNATLYFSTSYGLLNAEYRPYLGLFAVLMSAFYLGFGYLTWSRDREDKYLIYSFLGLSTLFLTLAVPIQLDQHWVTMGWAIEGAVLTWIGLKAGSRATRYSGLLMFAIAVLHWFRVDVHDFAYYSWQSFTPILNRRAFSVLVMIAAFAVAAWFYRRLGEQIEESERTRFAEICLLAANVLAVVWLSLDAIDHFSQLRDALISQHDLSDEFWFKRDGDVLLNKLENSRQLVLTALWSIYGAAALLVCIRRRVRLVRWFALALLMLAAIKVIVVDSNWYAAVWHTLILNRTCAAFVVTIAAFVCGAWAYKRAGGIDEDERRTALSALLVIANLLAVIALSLEALGYFDAKIYVASGDEVSRLGSAKQFWLTLVWTGYGTIVLLAGFRQRVKPIRLGALGLIGLAAGKVLMADAGYFKAPWHTLIFNYTFAAFALVIGAKAYALWLYKRTAEIEEDERRVAVPALLAAANLLAVTGLSLEAIGYFQARIDRSQGDAWQPINNTKHFTLSLLWSFYGAAALIIGIKSRRKLLRYGALVLLAVALAKVLLVDALYYDAPWHVLIFNQTFGAFVPLIAALAVGAWFYARASDIEAWERATALTAITITANVLAIIALSLEANGYFSAAISRVSDGNEELRNLTLAKQLSLSVIWALYAGAMLAVGFWRSNRLVRLMGLGLLVLAILKVFLFDMSSLDRLYRIVSFIVLGVILLVVSFLYQQRQKRTAEMSE